MSSNDSSKTEKKTVLEFLAPIEIASSGEDPPMSEWSSLVIEAPQENKKKALFSQGLYTPGSGEVCAKYIPMSDSDVFKHHYYNYPAVKDPGIEEALLIPENPIVYTDDGQNLYKALCKEINTCVIRMFHDGLITKEINLSYYGVDPFAIRSMALALQHNKTVRSFNLTDNFLNDDACYHLAQMLTTNNTINVLNLTGCRIGSSGILRLGATLAVNRSLEELNLARNCLGEDGGVYFAKQIEDGAGVPRINLNNNQLGRLTALAFAEALEYRNIITHFDLSWNNFFHAPSLVKMLDQLANSEVLQELDLSWNSLEGERIAASIKEVLLVPTLTKLNLSNNRLKDEAVTIIAGNLFRAKKLSLLNLSFNPFSTIDANVVLEKMLRPRVKIETLMLDGISVEKSFLRLLEKVMKMKSRKNFVVTYGRVLANWTLEGPNARTLVLERARFLGAKDKKRRVDIALYFLGLSKVFSKPIPVKVLIEQIEMDNVPLDEDLIVEISVAFAGPQTAKYKTVDIPAICDYIKRIWPDKELPPTPPPEPEPEPLPPPPSNPKGRKGKK